MTKASGGDGSFRTIDPGNRINTEGSLSVPHIGSCPNPEKYFCSPCLSPGLCHNRAGPITVFSIVFWACPVCENCLQAK